MKGSERRANWGLGLGFVVVIAFLIASTYLIRTGHEISGAVLGTVDLVALAGTFVYGRSTQKESGKGPGNG